MKIVSSLIFFLLAFPVLGQAQYWLSKQACVELERLYRYESISDSTLDQEEKLYLDGYASFLNFLADENPKWIDKLEDVNDAINNSEVLNSKTHLMLVNLGIQQGLMKLISGDELDGAYLIYSAYKVFYNIDSGKCDAIEYQKLDALFTIFASQVEAQNGIVSWLFGIKGNELIGFEKMNAYLGKVQSCVGLETEGQVLYAYLQLKFGQLNEVELTNLIGIAEQKSSPLLTFVMGLNGLKNQKSDQVIEMLLKVDDWGYKSFPLLSYIKGKALLNKMDLNGCKALTTFGNTFKGNSYTADATFRLARYYHATNDTSGRDSLLALMETIQDYPTALDKQARSESAQLAESPPVLSKARFYFDGGYLLDAQKVLLAETVQVYSKQYQSEFHYRLARVEHQLGNMDRALSEYEKVVSLSKDDQRYFGPYSALFMAKYYVKNGEIRKASQSIEQARILNNGEYKSDISLEINRIKLLLPH